MDTAVVTVMLSELLSEPPPESATRTVKFEVADAVGVPVIAPVAAAC